MRVLRARADGVERRVVVSWHAVNRYKQRVRQVSDEAAVLAIVEDIAASTQVQKIGDDVYQVTGRRPARLRYRVLVQGDTYTVVTVIGR